MVKLEAKIMGINPFWISALLTAAFLIVCATGGDNVNWGYGTICSSENRSTLWDSDVGTTMVANFTSNGVCAVALRRCDCACHRQWPLQSTVRENRIHAGGHEFPTPLHEATQEFTPKDCGIFP